MGRHCGRPALCREGSSRQDKRDRNTQANCIQVSCCIFKYRMSRRFISENLNLEDKESTKLDCKKILRRQHPARSESDSAEMFPSVPVSQTIMTRNGKSNKSTEHEQVESQKQKICIVKGESITRRLPPCEPIFEASDPVDDVGDSL